MRKVGDDGGEAACRGRTDPPMSIARIGRGAHYGMGPSVRCDSRRQGTPKPPGVAALASPARPGFRSIVRIFTASPVHAPIGRRRRRWPWFFLDRRATCTGWRRVRHPARSECDRREEGSGPGSVGRLIG